LTSAPSTGATKSSTISNQLLNSFEPGDLRKMYWIGVYPVNASLSYYFPFKYQNATSTITEYETVLRLAEQYLIRAEAEAKLNDLGNAATDLNVIRKRAGLSNIADSVAANQDLLLAAILHERQVELFTEWGHRWFDLIRTGTINSVMGGASGACQVKGGTWASTDQLFPIPQTEINNDPALSQNVGY
jgi:hypothetical protein